MTLFTVGPVEMDPAIRELGSAEIPYFRTSQFSDKMKRIERNYLNLINAGKDSQGMILTTSGSGAMDAAVSSVFRPESDKVLIIQGGTFGERFTDICRHYRIPCESLIVPFEQDLAAADLEPYRNQGFTGLLVNHHETSIGKLYDLKMLGDFCRDEGLYFIVDAVSSFLCDPIDMYSWGIDLLLTASQKALALPPGLALTACSRRLLEERILVQDGLSYALSLKKAADNQLRGQTPFTPALGIIHQLDQRLTQVREHGLAREFASRHALADHFRRRVSEELPFAIPGYRKSPALTPLLTEPMDAYELFLTLKDEHDLVITPSGGAMSRRLTRVGHMGYQTPSDLDRLMSVMKDIAPQG